MFVTDNVLHYTVCVCVCACTCTYIRSVYSCFPASKLPTITMGDNVKTMTQTTGGGQNVSKSFPGAGNRLGGDTGKHYPQHIHTYRHCIISRPMVICHVAKNSNTDQEPFSLDVELVYEQVDILISKIRCCKYYAHIIMYKSQPNSSFKCLNTCTSKYTAPTFIIEAVCLVISVQLF